MAAQSTPYDDLLEILRHSGAFASPRIEQAFRVVKRADFIPSDMASWAGEDRPLPIGPGQTISQPSTMAFMLRLLGVQPGHRILDIGSGSGWSTALLAELTGPPGRVIGLEVVSDVAEFGRRNLAKYRYPWASIREAGPELGLPAEAPFARILVSAAAHSLPQDLVWQLEDGGVLVMPVDHDLIKITRDGQSWTQETFPGFNFVPLIR